MKFLALAALIGATTATKTDAKVELRSEMQSLLTLVKTVDQKDKTAIFTAIENRKNDLKKIALAKPQRKEFILNELSNLKALVQTVDSNNYDGAMKELTARKNDLMNIHKDLMVMADEAPAGDDKKTDDKKTDDKKADDKKEVDVAALEKAVTDAKALVDAAEKKLGPTKSRATFFSDATPRTYRDSVAYCARQGATIASIASDVDNSEAAVGVLTTSYLGARADGQGNWMWEDGSAWAYKPLTTGDALAGVEDTQLAYQVGKGDGKDNMWVSVEGGGQRLLGVICRREGAVAGDTPDCSVEPPLEIVDPICDADCHNCTGHGICMNNAVCSCHPDWMGGCCQTPNIPCYPVQDCNAPQGECVLGVCQCSAGFTGVSCEVDIQAAIHDEYVKGLKDGLQNVHTCPNGCSNNGVCDSTNGKCTCSCPSRMADCSDCPRYQGVCPFNCSGHGLCVRGECHCYPGNMGEGCEVFELTCPDHCSGQGLCVDGQCHCIHGYNGDGCEEGPAFRGCPRNCSGHGRCHMGRCHCPCGFHGDACEVSDGQCPHGCTGRGSCSLRTNECSCAPGFFGSDCSVRSVDPVSLDCVDDAATAGLGTLADGEAIDVLCPPGCEMSGGTIYGGSDEYTSHSRICKAAFHAGSIPSQGGLATVTIKRASSFTGSARNGVTSESDNEPGRAFHVGSPWMPGTPREILSHNITCDTTGMQYRPMALGYTIDLMCPAGCDTDPVVIYGGQATGGYADHSGVCKAAVHAGVIKADDGGMVVYKSFPRTEKFESSTANGLTSADLESYDERTFQFTSQASPSPGGDIEGTLSWWDASSNLTALIKTEFDVCAGNCSCKGTCGTEGGNCICDGGSFTPDCSVSPAFCGHINHCSGQGLCEVEECHCGDGFTGESCEEPAYDLYCPQNCTGHGQCIRGVCHCYTGWKSDNCADMDMPCFPPCNSNQTCMGAQCICIPGYTGANCEEIGTDIDSLEAHVCRTASSIASLLARTAEGDELDGIGLDGIGLDGIGLDDLLVGYDPEGACDARSVCMMSSLKSPRSSIYTAIDDHTNILMGTATALQELVETCNEIIYHYFDGFMTYNVRLLRDQLFIATKELVDLDPTIYAPSIIEVDEVVRHWGHADNVKLMLRNAEANGVAGATELVSQMKVKRDALAEAVAMSVAKLLNASAVLDDGPHPLATLLVPGGDTTLPRETSDGALSLTCKATAASWEYRQLTGLSETPVTVACPANCATPGMGGEVWGTGVYTDDSSLCKAGLHAGFVDPVEGGTMRVQMVPGRPRYPGSLRSDIATRDHDIWLRAFIVCPDGTEDMAECSNSFEPPNVQSSTALASRCGEAVTARDLHMQDGTSVTILCSSPCVLEGVVWGDGTYTDDSSICKAAVHMGVLGEDGGPVLATAGGAFSSFPSVNKNGVSSAEYKGGQWDVTFAVSAGSDAARVADGAVSCLTTGKSNLLSSLREHERAVVVCPAGCGGGPLRLWGSDIYTDDSKVCQAAIHLGVINEGGGHVTVTIMPGLPLYRSSIRHGIRSLGFLTYSRSFTVSSVTELPPGTALLQTDKATAVTTTTTTTTALSFLELGAASPHLKDVAVSPDATPKPTCVIEGIISIGVHFTPTFPQDYSEAFKGAMAEATGSQLNNASLEVKLPSVRAGDKLGSTIIEYQVLVTANDNEVGAEFIVDAKPRSYAKSAAYCIALGARIASVHTEDEHRRVMTMITTTSFLGARGNGAEGWAWDDGSDWDYKPTGTEDELAMPNLNSRLSVVIFDPLQPGAGEWHAWDASTLTNDEGAGERKLGVVCRRPSFASSTLDRARALAITINDAIDEGAIINGMVDAGIPPLTAMTPQRLAVASCPHGGTQPMGAKTEDALREMAAQGWGDVNTPMMWTGFDEATIRLSNGMSIRELVAAVSDTTNIDEFKRLIAMSPVLEERDAIQHLIAASNVLSARGKNEIPDSNLMYMLRVRIKQAAIDMYRLDPSSIQNPRLLTPAALTDAVSMPSTKADLRTLAAEQPSLKRSIDVLINAVNGYASAQSHVTKEIRVLAYEIREWDQTMVPDLTRPYGTRSLQLLQSADATKLSQDTEYVTSLEQHRNRMDVTAPGTRYAHELLVIALRTVAGALPFSPVNYGDLQAQRMFTLDTANQLRNLGETEPFVEGTFVMTTLKLSKIYNDPDMELALRVIAKNVMTSLDKFPDRDLSNMSREELMAELIKGKQSGESEEQIAAMSLEEMMSAVRLASEVGADDRTISNSHMAAQLALDCIASNTALDDLVRAALYYLTLSLEQLSANEPRLVMASGLASETQLHCVFGVKIYPWIDRLAGDSAMLSVADLRDRVAQDADSGKTLEPEVLGTILKSVTVGLTGTGDDETLRRSLQEPLSVLLELYASVAMECQELQPEGRPIPALVVRDMVQHGLTGALATAASEANANVPLECRQNVQRMAPPLAAAQAFMQELEKLLLVLAIEVQTGVPVAVPSLQGVLLNDKNLVKEVCTSTVVFGIVRYLERVDTCSAASSFDADPHGVLETETDILAFRLLNLITIVDSVALPIPCPGDGDDEAASAQCNGNGMCMAGNCVCFEMFGGPSCANRRSQDEIFDDGYETGLRSAMENAKDSTQLDDVLSESINRLTGCGDAVKQTTKELAELNSRCGDVWATGRLSPLEILDKLEVGEWHDELRLCAAGDGASNVTAFRHLVPRLLLEGATLRREVQDFHTMMKQLLVVATTHDCKVAEYLQYDLAIASVPCHERAASMSDMNKDDIGAVVATKGSLQNLQNLIRSEGTFDVKATVDSLIEIVVTMIKLSACQDSCHAHGDCVENVCVCDQGFKGVSCGQEMPLLPGMCLRNCSKRGDCLDGQCSCYEGWKGADCSVSSVCPNGCSGHGDCIDGVCDCYRKWKGLDCSRPREICPDDYRCYKGVCVRSLCECFHGWTGDDCTIGDFFKDHPPFKDPNEESNHDTEGDPEAFFSLLDISAVPAGNDNTPTAIRLEYSTENGLEKDSANNNNNNHDNNNNNNKNNKNDNDNNNNNGQRYRELSKSLLAHHRPMLLYVGGLAVLGVALAAAIWGMNRRQRELGDFGRRVGRDGNQELTAFHDSDIREATQLI